MANKLRYHPFRPELHHKRYPVYDLSQLGKKRIPEAYHFGLNDQGQPEVIRRIFCTVCDTCLAEEVGSRGQRGVEWRQYWPNGKETTECWWGNAFQCACCGMEGKLPMDRPLYQESPANITEV